MKSSIEICSEEVAFTKEELAIFDHSFFLKHCCLGGSCFLCYATTQILQYLFLTPEKGNFLVCTPKMTATPLLALYTVKK